MAQDTPRQVVAAVGADHSVLFEGDFSDAGPVAGSLTPDGCVRLYAHKCPGAGGAGGPLFAAAAATCPHALALKAAVAELAKNLDYPSDALEAIEHAVPSISAQRAPRVRGVEHVWTERRGWRSGEDLLAPVELAFARDPALDPSLYADPDPGYVVDDKTFARLDLAASSPLYEAVLLVGPSGHGKSKAAREWCARRNRPYWELTLGMDSRVESVMGGVGLENGSTVRRPGLADILGIPGGTLILNELTAVSQREWSPLWPALEKGCREVKVEVEGQRYSLPVHPTAMVIATANEAKGLHAEANGGQGFAQLRRLTVVPVKMTASQVVAVARSIATARLSGASIDVGSGATVEIADRSEICGRLDWRRLAKLVAHLMDDEEAAEVIEVSPEVVAWIAVDAAVPGIGIAEALRSHLVSKAWSTWGQEIVARTIVASGLFPEFTG